MKVFEKKRFGTVYFYPGVVETLSKLSGIVTVGLITNGNSDPVRAGIDKYFDHIILGEKYPFKKPDPRLFKALLDAADCKHPNRAMHVGDSLQNDVFGANQSGMISVWFNSSNAENLSNHHAAHTISKFPELFEILKLYY